MILLTLIFDLLLLQFQCLNVILDIITALFLARLDTFTSFFKHYHLKLHLSLFVKKLISFVFQSLKFGLVLIDHFFLHSLVFLVDFERLLFVDCESFELRFDLIGDCDHVIRIKELIP